MGDTRGQFVSALRTGLVLLVPILVVVCPLLVFLSYSFFDVQDREIVYDISLANYFEMFGNEAYRSVFLRTIKLALEVTMTNLILGYCVAYVIWQSRPRTRALLMLGVAVPLLLSYVIKIYAVRSLLGFNGLFNNLMMWSGLVDAPLDFLLFNMTAVRFTLSVVLLPFAILPIFVSLDRLAPSLLQASADLGASGFQTFVRVILPLSTSGVVLAATFTFVLSVGDFLVPELVGGVNGFTFGRLIFTQFGLAYNWPLGAAFSVVLLFVSLTVIVVGQRISKPKWQDNNG